jgi:hypothetical protein
MTEEEWRRRLTDGAGLVAVADGGGRWASRPALMRNPGWPS